MPLFIHRDMLTWQELLGKGHFENLVLKLQKNLVYIYDSFVELGFPSQEGQFYDYSL